jgi:hypothetical protein
LDTVPAFFNLLLAYAIFAAAIALYILAGVAVIVAVGRWLRRIFRFAPLESQGHVAIARITGCRQDGKRRYVPLVSFVTASGEKRDNIPVFGPHYTDPPLPAGQAYGVKSFAAEVSSWSYECDPRRPAPPIGGTVRIVYDPAHQDSVSFPTGSTAILRVFLTVLILALAVIGFFLFKAELSWWRPNAATVLSFVAFTIFGATGFGPAFACARSLLIYSRHRQLEKSGYVTAATPEFHWNIEKARYEPVLRFATNNAEVRQRVLGWDFDYARLPKRDPCTIVYDPRDATYAELAYTQGSAPRPTVSVAISAVVALFVILPLFTYFFALGVLPQIAAPFAAGCALGAAVAWHRTKRLA